MSRYCFFFTMVAAVVITGCKQPAEADNTVLYDTKKMRLLVQTAGLNIFTSDQGMIDLDSAMKLACNAQQVSTSLWYDEGYHEQSNTKGQEMLDKNDIPAAMKLCESLNGKEKIPLLLQLGNYFLFKPGRDSGDIKNSIDFLQQAAKQSELFPDKLLHREVLTTMGKYYAQLGDATLSNALLSQVVSETQRTGDAALVANALNNKGSWLPYNDTSKVNSLRESFSIYQQQGNKLKQIELMNKIVDIHFRSGKMDSAASELLQTLIWQQDIGFRHTHYTHSVLSFLYYIKSDYADQFYHALDAVKIMKATGDTTFAASFYMRLGNAFAITNRIDDAVLQYKLAINSENANPIFFYKNCSSAATALASDGRGAEGLALLNTLVAKYPPNNSMDKMILANTYGNVYLMLNNDSIAEKHLLNAAAIGESINNVQTASSVAACYASLGKLYVHKNDVINASRFLALSERVPANKLDGNTQANNLRTQYFIDSLTGNFPVALKSFQKLTSFLNQRAAVDVEAKYQTTKKEQDIQSLNKQAALQQIQLTQANTIKNITLGAVVLLIIVISLIYNQYRMNRKNSILVSKKNESLQELLTEKEWLLREIHHRVKNNLHTITSLLESQSRYLQDDALSAIKDSQHRVQAMSLIHQKLYSKDSLTTINLPDYVHELLEYLRESFDSRHLIKFYFEVDPIDLDVAQAVPLGLILNEAITNAFKYAFPTMEVNSKIAVAIKQPQEDQITLQVADNGIGLPENFDEHKKGALGMILMRGLSSEIKADLSIYTDNGTTVFLHFNTSKFPKKIMLEQMETAFQ